MAPIEPGRARGEGQVLVDPPRAELAGAVVELGPHRDVSTPLNRAIADIPALHAGGIPS